MAMRTVRTDPEILHCAIVDGINLYIREVLEMHAILSDERLVTLQDSRFDEMKHAIAKKIADRWEKIEIQEEG